MKVEIAPNADSHPGLAPVLSQALRRALELGFRLLPMTNWGTVRSPQVTNDMRAHIGGWEDYWAYADRLSDCSRFIAQMGCGSHNYSLLKVSQDEIPPNQFARAVGEWVDGDALSAHYAYWCDVFCTNDRAVNAGSGSIFHPDNLKAKGKIQNRCSVARRNVVVCRLMAKENGPKGKTKYKKGRLGGPNLRRGSVPMPESMLA
jgi:hypothetical protein